MNTVLHGAIPTARLPRQRSQHYVSFGEWKLVRVHEAAEVSATALTCPVLAVRYWNDHIATMPAFNPEVETVVVVALNCKFVPKGHQITSLGTVDEAIIHAREVFRAAIVASAHSVLLMHNHPTGDPTPTPSDTRATRHIQEAARILHIALRDHIIVGKDWNYSYRNEGNLK